MRMPPPDTIFRRRHFRVQKFCLRDARKCDDREKEEERELRGQLRPEKLGGPFLPLMCSYFRYWIQCGPLVRSTDTRSFRMLGQLLIVSNQIQQYGKFSALEGQFSLEKTFSGRRCGKLHSQGFATTSPSAAPDDFANEKNGDERVHPSERS